MRLLDHPLDMIGIATIARGVREGRLSAVALIESRLARIERLNPQLNCFTEILSERARRQADAVDAMVAAGRDPGPLAGVPFGVKDNYDVAGRVTAAGSIPIGQPMLINDPATLAAITDAFWSYEKALMTNDIEALDDFFWPSEFTVRIGPGQNLYGIDVIKAFRLARVGGSPQRALLKTVITSFGTDFATANAEFQRVGAPVPGRQSQTWVRFAEGWRVVSAHISLLGEGN